MTALAGCEIARARIVLRKADFCWLSIGGMPPGCWNPWRGRGGGGDREARLSKVRGRVGIG